MEIDVDVSSSIMSFTKYAKFSNYKLFNIHFLSTTYVLISKYMPTHVGILCTSF